MKVLFAPTDMAGHAWGMRSGLERHGVEVDVLSLSKDPYGFGSNLNYSREHYPKVFEPLVRARYFASLVPRYDIFHFVNASSFLPRKIDVRLLSACHRPIFVTLNGTNTRLKDHALDNYRFSQFAVDGRLTENKEYLDDYEKRKLLKFWGKVANKIFCLNPDLCHGASNAVFIPYAKSSFYNLEARIPQPNKRIVRIAHAPTNRGVKGSDYFFAALDRLKGRYKNFELVLIEGVDNSSALEMMADCDVLFDQLLVGWYGGVAVEAMKLGKPVIAYIREEDLVFVPEEMRRSMPILNANPETIEHVLEQILVSPEVIHNLGQKSLEYVTRFHDPENVAAQVLKYYQLT